MNKLSAFDLVDHSEGEIFILLRYLPNERQWLACDMQGRAHYITYSDPPGVSVITNLIADKVRLDWLERNFSQLSGKTLTRSEIDKQMQQMRHNDPEKEAEHVN